MPPVPSSPVLLFDGECVLCSSMAGMVLRVDRTGRLLLGALQSQAGEQLLRSRGAWPPQHDSIVLIDEDGVHWRSDAVLRVLRLLGGWWRIAAVARLVPRRVRDAVYDAVARRRRAWFGRRACRVPAPHERGRFLEG